MIWSNWRALEDEYREALAVWQIEHNANLMDMTPEQDERYRLHNRLVDAGLDGQHIEYARWLVRAGVVSDGN